VGAGKSQLFYQVESQTLELSEACLGHIGTNNQEKAL
jgi:hypothetical protein